MATLYSKGTGGNWSTLGTFNTLANGTGTDTIPTGGSGGDDVIIQKNHTVTLNDTTCVAKSLKLDEVKKQKERPVFNPVRSGKKIK